MIEKYRHTDWVCEECGNEGVQDIFKGEFYCLKCGLVKNIEPFDYKLRRYIYENHTNE